MPSQFELDYISLIDKIKRKGVRRETRNYPTFSLFGETLEIRELEQGIFPILTGRKMYYKGVLGEFAAFIHGVDKLEDFEKFGCNYWRQWANKDGSIKVDYGNTWRNFEGYDQLAKLIETLKTNPADRRMLISGWRPHALAELSLPCCHLLYQWYVNADTNRLEMIWYQRSVDVMVGLPSDIILAAIWNITLAAEVGLKPGKITMMLGDTHIYSNHAEAAMQYCRQSFQAPYSPKYKILAGTKCTTFTPDEFELIDYHPANPIKFEVHT
jgi:thymidylate synthase